MLFTSAALRSMLFTAESDPSPALETPPPDRTQPVAGPPLTFGTRLLIKCPIRTHDK